MQSDDDIAAYTQRVAQTWGVGQRSSEMAAVFSSSLRTAKMFIQVGTVWKVRSRTRPRSTSRIPGKPHFRKIMITRRLGRGDRFDLQGGPRRIQRTGTTSTNAERMRRASFLFFIIFFVFVLSIISRIMRKLAATVIRRAEEAARSSSQWGLAAAAVGPLAEAEAASVDSAVAAAVLAAGGAGSSW